MPAAPDPVQPAIAIVPPAEPQQIRPVQVVLTPKQEEESSDAEDLFQQAYLLRDSQPERAKKMFMQVVIQSPRGSKTQEKAMAQLAAMNAPPLQKELYLRGYQLKDTSPAEARAFFERVIAATPESDEYHQKAKSQLQRLSAAP